MVFHLAAIRITQCAEEPRLAHDVLATGTFNVVEAAAADAGTRKVVASSSASIYGQAEVFPTREDHHPWANDTLYGAAKVYNEGVLRSFHAMTGLDYVALRYFNVYGPRMDIHGLYTEVLIRWMERIAAGQPPLILGDGLQTMDFVDVRDIARANLLAARAAVTDRVYNIAAGSETSLNDLAEGCSGRWGGPTCAPSTGRPARSTRSRDGWPTSAAARDDLGFGARITLDQGLTRPGRLVACGERGRHRTNLTRATRPAVGHDSAGGSSRRGNRTRPWPPARRAAAVPMPTRRRGTARRIGPSPGSAPSCSHSDAVAFGITAWCSTAMARSDSQIV